MRRADFLVIGSGIAGLSFALEASELGNVFVVTKKGSADTATNRAQGGIAAVLDEKDSFKEHILDTLESGDGICDENVVDLVVKDGPERIKKLMQQGVDFARNEEGSLSLGREGGHSCRRVAHAGDLTGREIERALLAKVSENQSITVFENEMCVDLIVKKDEKGKNICIGATVIGKNNVIESVLAKIVVLCTGGAGKVYLYTSNPDIATGDGIAIAKRAGAQISNMEFVQFHPTCLYHHNAKNFLISEAVRGEGAYLKTRLGERFLSRYEPEMMELSTRDKVARAIDEEMKKSGEDCVFLDISHKDPTFIRQRFPNIYSRCLDFGIDISKDSLPVVPAAHYFCGGVKTDTDGQTSITNLFALGETACTGLHGGNRLASNSLLEAVVFSHRAYQYCRDNWENISEEKQWDARINDKQPVQNRIKLDEEILINHNWDIIRRTMWNYVGIVRKTSRLQSARKIIEDVQNEIASMVSRYEITPNMLELRNISIVAKLVVEASLERKESRGLHYILD